MPQLPVTSLTERLASQVSHDGGFALLLLFCAQQLTMMMGIVLLISGLSLWSGWLVFVAMLSLRGCFFLQAVHQAIGDT